MTNSTVYQFRIDPYDKQQAFAVFDSLGINPAQAIRLFLKQVSETKQLPFNLPKNAQQLDDVASIDGFNHALLTIPKAITDDETDIFARDYQEIDNRPLDWV